MRTSEGWGEGLEGEYEGAALGDVRLGRRLVRIALQAATGPESSFPATADSDSELEGTYRFLSNERVTASEILSPHIRQTVRRAAKVGGNVVIAHDTTEFNFGQTGRHDLGRVGQGKSFGFYGHFSLAVSRDEERRPLGVVGIAIHERSGDKGVRNNMTKQLDPGNEGLRWGRSVAHGATVLPNAIHVMDREADSYALMAELSNAGRRFVVRMAQARRKLASGDGLNVGETVIRAKAVATREVPICARKPSKMPSYRKHHPPRGGRLAKLEVSCTAVVLIRPESSSLSPAKELALNVVRVFEPNPPAGEPPVEWRLWTTEPVETPEQVLAVVDAYRCRWVIEEYFKALKTGCAIEKRQLETTHALVNTVALFAAIAWRLLLLRTLAHQAPATSASAVLSEAQVACLDFLLRRRKRPALPPSPTVADALL